MRSSGGYPAASFGAARGATPFDHWASQVATQRLLHVIPVAIQPQKRLQFVRAGLYEGISLCRAAGPLARQVAEQAKALQVQSGFMPTHLIVIEQNQYFEGLDSRLTAEGKTRDKGKYEHIDLNSIARQVLVATSLCGHCTWQLGGNYTIDLSDKDFPYSSAGYRHQDTVAVADLLRYSVPHDWFRDIQARDLRTVCLRLDRYYRSGTWWVDRLSVALGYLWSGMTARHSELAFISFCMALEAVASTTSSEITHILAERCALLMERSSEGRLRAYEEVKALYALRSKIVHGRSTPRTGPITSETLAITAKRSFVPRAALFRILAVAIAVINGVLRRPDLMALLHVRRSEHKASDALNEYFQKLLLRGEA